MRLASFNLENLFERARALNLDSWEDGRPALEAYSRLNKVFNKATYSASDKQAILDGLRTLGLLKKDDAGQFAILRQNRGHLLKRPTSGPVQVVAGGRGDWVGWLELKPGPVNEIATQNTAQVIRDVNADVFGVVEVDNRIALKRFNDQVLAGVGGAAYRHSMVIDGNDDRGIDVGIMTHAAHPIRAIRSHVDDGVDTQRIFSRDCPEYDIGLPSGGTLTVLVNHFKSKGFGSPTESNARRRQQAQRVRDIYDSLRLAGLTLIAVVGDLNDVPDSDPLAPLLGPGSELRDVSRHHLYKDDGRPGTFGNGTKSQKLDYILLSPALFNAVTAAGVFRKGVWGGKNGDLWEIYPEMTKPVHAASDHAAIWVDLAI